MPSKSIDEITEIIRNFYERDDISRQMPGIKDAKSIKTSTGKKLRIQKRTMIMSVREAFELFQISFPEISIGKTLFYNERPAYVLPVNETPHNVCVCIIHSNYINLVTAISKHVSDFPKTHRELLNQVSCNIDNENCMSNDCDVCKNSNIWNTTLDSNPNVEWKTWILEHQIPKQIVVNKPFREALDELRENLSCIF